MMKTFSPALTKRNDPGRDQQPLAAPSSGFSLVEVLVTLGVIGLAAMIVVPNLGSGLASASRHSLRQDLARQVVDLRKLAIDDRVTLQIARSSPGPADRSEGDLPAFQLPRGWSYATDRQVAIGSDGYCTGGVIEIARDDIVQGRYVLEPGRCDLRRS